MDFAFERCHLPGEFGRQPRQPDGIDLDAVALHLRKHRRQWPVDHLVNARRPLHRQARLEPPPEPQRDIGILGGIAGGGFQVDFCKAALAFARADHILERDTAVLKV